MVRFANGGQAIGMVFEIDRGTDRKLGIFEDDVGAVAQFQLQRGLLDLPVTGELGNGHKRGAGEHQVGGNGIGRF